MEYLFVGIDPGIKMGVAIINTEGELLGLASFKSEREVINFILSFGKPMVIASDKKNAPEMVKRFSAMFRAKLYTPSSDISLAKKKRIGYFIKDEHARDAYVSALKAYKRYEAKFRQIEKMSIPDKKKMKYYVVMGMRRDKAKRKIENEILRR